MKTCDRYPWSSHNEIIHKSDNPIIDIENLIFIIGGDQGIQSYMDIIHNFSKQEEEYVEKAYLASNKIEEKLDDLFFETLKLKKKKKLSLEEIEYKIQECISQKGIEVKRSDYKKYLYHLLINMEIAIVKKSHII